MGLDPALAGAVAGFVIFAVIAFSCTCYRRRRSRNISEIMLRRSAHAQLIRDWVAQRETEINKCKAEEEARDNGSQVWFSRYVHQGRLRHWVLIINGTKYELKEDKNSGKFVFRIKEHQSWNAEMAKRNAALKEKYKPEVDGPRKKYVCLVGWTKLSTPELKSIAVNIYDRFGVYHLLWNNCQTILQEFSDEILHKHALDYPWFREHTRTEFQQNQEPPRPPTELTYQQIQLQRQILLQTHNHQATHQLQQDLALQLTLLQIQMQTDLGLNAAQMQMVVNPALFNPSMDAATNPALNPATNPALNPAINPALNPAIMLC